ncbi:hypothetical protein ASD74_03230 [Rhizobium sp. Root564]|nr:hypothetical protein ASD74_03230 [Rhizobium sp. Root564]
MQFLILIFASDVRRSVDNGEGNAALVLLSRPHHREFVVCAGSQAFLPERLLISPPYENDSFAIVIPAQTTLYRR